MTPQPSVRIGLLCRRWGCAVVRTWLVILLLVPQPLSAVAQLLEVTEFIPENLEATPEEKRCSQQFEPLTPRGERVALQLKQSGQSAHFLVPRSSAAGAGPASGRRPARAGRLGSGVCARC
jgi:hypothetical protein